MTDKRGTGEKGTCLNEYVRGRSETKCLNECDREENKRLRAKKKTQREGMSVNMNAVRKMNTVGRT